MDYEEKYEAEIDLSDLLPYILFKWRSIIAVGFIFAVLLGSYKIFRDLQSQSDGVQSKEFREYEIALAEYQLAETTYERNITDFQVRLTQQETYMEKSVLMQVDPYEKPTASADIFLKLDETEWGILPDNVNLDPTDSLIRVYTSNFPSTIDWAPIEALTGREAIYLKELLSVGTDYNSNTFTVGVVYSDGETAQQILDIIVGQIMAKYHGMDSDVNKHTISIVNQSLAYTIDNALANTQKNNADAMANYTQSILDCRKGLEGLVLPKPPSGIGFLKYSILGLAAGAFLTCMFYGMVYIFDGKLHGERELKKRYGYRCLGAFSATSPKKILYGIDRFFERLTKTSVKMTEEEIYQFISVNVANLMGEYKNILVTGTTDVNKIQKLTAAIAPQLEGAVLTAAADMNHTPSTLKMLALCDAVILVEEKHKSLNADVRKEQESVCSLGKPVLGYVLL